MSATEHAWNAHKAATDGTDLTALYGGGVRVTVARYGDRFGLRWDDGIANEWLETYPTLSSALARAAVLAACAESGWERFFLDGEKSFAIQARRFVAGCIL